MNKKILFNLERALAGDPVVTRDGRPVTDISKVGSLISGIISGKHEFWFCDGNNSTTDDTEIDLFMASLPEEQPEPVGPNKITPEQIELLQQWKDNPDAEWEWFRQSQLKWVSMPNVYVPMEIILKQYRFRIKPKPEPKKRIQGYMNISKGDIAGSRIFRTRNEADQAGKHYDRIACIEIDVEEGTGLEGEQ